MARAPHGWRTRIYIGATPDFGAAHLAVEALLPPPRPELLRASIDMARQLAAAFPGGATLTRAAALAERGRSGANPWSLWVAVLARAHRVPQWPQAIEDCGDGLFRLRLSCPYYRASARWARVALDLLWLADGAVREGSTQASQAAWQARLQTLGADIPEAGLMALHKALQAAGLPWRWPGGDRTLVGSGSRQRVVRGADGRPEERAQRLAALAPCIPTYTVTGSLGKTTTIRLMSQLLAASGLRLGLTASDGAWADGSQVGDGDCIDGPSAARMLRRRDIDIVLLEVGRGGIVGQGIPYDRSDVAVLLNVAAVHLGRQGIDSVEAMADAKALSLRRGRIAVLNRDDAQCRRIGSGLDPASCVWFSTGALPDALREISRNSKAALGVRRDPDGAPAALTVWRAGAIETALPLADVAPYHGMLGEKTLEEVLAAVAAVRFGPVPIDAMETLLPGLRLDNVNHRFRTSLHRRGALLFLLDKAGERASLELLEPVIEAICTREGVGRRIVALNRHPAYALEDQLQSCATLHPLFDEFICFDIPEGYAKRSALPIYAPGSIPGLLRDELARLNACAGIDKPISVAADWDEAEAHLRERLAAVEDATLVLINQPITGAFELNRRIVHFVEEYV